MGRVKRALRRAQYAAIGAAVGAALGGLFSRSAASTGGATGALVGALVAEFRDSESGLVNRVKPSDEETDEQAGLNDRLRGGIDGRIPGRE